MFLNQHLEALHYKYNSIMRMFINLTTYFHVDFGSPTNNAFTPYDIYHKTYLGALDSPLEIATKNHFGKPSRY